MIDFNSLYGDPHHAFECHGPSYRFYHLVWYNPQTGDLEAFEMAGEEGVQVPLSAVPDYSQVEEIPLCY